MFSGGLKTAFSFTLDTTPFFMRTNSVIPMQSEIRIVAIKENFSLSETYLYGEYSDDVKIAYDGRQFKISVERFHKNTS